MQRNITGQNFKFLVCPPQEALVTANVGAAEVPRYIQYHAAQVDQWRQIINMEDILKQQLLA